MQDGGVLESFIVGGDAPRQITNSAYNDAKNYTQPMERMPTSVVNKREKKSETRNRDFAIATFIIVVVTLVMLFAFYVLKPNADKAQNTKTSQNTQNEINLKPAEKTDVDLKEGTFISNMTNKIKDIFTQKKETGHMDQRNSAYRSHMLNNDGYGSGSFDMNEIDTIKYMRSAASTTVPTSRTAERDLLEYTTGLSDDISNDNFTDSDKSVVDQHFIKKNREKFNKIPSGMTAQRELMERS
jgi:hypothetical protein